MHSFILGKEYGREQLLDFIGSGQLQSGVLWGSREPGCLICTSGGRHGKKAGYADELLDDGSWLYIGQGQTGNQSLKNAANAKLASGQKSILFFTTREPTAREVATQGGYGKLFAFRGSFNISGVEFFQPREGPRKNDQLLKFHLIPADSNAISWTGAAATPDLVDLAALRHQLNTYSQNTVVPALTTREYRKRSSQVHQYALLRAAGTCEGCHLKAPFVNEYGDYFLEVHHLLRLADDGPDSPENVAALCPNCHRRAHHSIDRKDFGRKLCAYILEVENRISSGNPVKST